MSLEKIAKILGLLFSLMVVCSYFYETGFLWYLNSNHVPVPLTIDDYKNSFTYWLPDLLIMVLIIYFIEFLTKVIEKGMTEDEIIATSSNPTFTKKFRDFPDILNKWLVLAVFLIYVLFMKIDLGANASTVRMLLSLTWILVMGIILIKTPLILFRWHPLLILSIILVPLIMTWFWLSGINDAFKNINKLPTKKEQVIRYYDKGNIILNEKNEILWCATSEKSSCSLLSNKKPKIIIQGIFCSTNSICFPNLN